MSNQCVVLAGTLMSSPLDLHYYRFESQPALERIEKHGKKHRKWKEEVLAKASRKNSLSAFDKLTDVVGGRRIIRARRAKGRCRIMRS